LLPGELLKKIRDAQREENRPQFDYLCLGPLYYLTLGELIPILNQHVGRSTAERFGGGCFVKQLENILGPRNALCHGRRVPSVGLEAIESLYHQMETALTSDGLAEMISTPDVGLPPEDAAQTLLGWMKEASKMIADLSYPVPISNSYHIATQQYWWGNPDLAGFDCLPTEHAALLIGEYNSLPTGLGSAATRLRFNDDRKPIQAINNAVKELYRVTQ